MPEDTRPIVLSLRGVTKRFGPLVANEGVDLDVRAGEIVALLGENGAGKTTLMNILFGHYVADEGSVWLADAAGALEPLPQGSPHAALEAGIGMVHQHFTLAENLTGFENIVLGTAAAHRARAEPERGAAACRCADAATSVSMSRSTCASRSSRSARSSASRSSRRSIATRASSCSTSRPRC